MERAVPILPVDDLRIARQFYLDALGFTVTFESSEDGQTGLLGVARGAIALTLDMTPKRAVPVWFASPGVGTPRPRDPRHSPRHRA